MSKTKWIIITWLSILTLALIALGSSWYFSQGWSNAEDQADAAQQQVITFAAQLDAACEAGVIEGSACSDAATVVESAPAPMPDVPPIVIDVTAQLAVVVADAFDACIASGGCVGPPGEAGEDGAAGEPGKPGVDGIDGIDGSDAEPPSITDLALAVAAACQTSLDCEATPQEVAEAVAAFCGQDTEPCGRRWSEREIELIALRVVTEYAFAHPAVCPPLNEIDPDEPFFCPLSNG